MTGPPKEYVGRCHQRQYSDMQGLELTYQTLATTRNEAAVDVLIAALDDSNPANRRRALGALLSRTEPRASQQVLENWDKLNADDLRVLRPKKTWLADTIDKALRGKGEAVLTAVIAAEGLELTTVLPQLTLLAESSASRDIQQRASQAVIAIVQSLGRASAEPIVTNPPFEARSWLGSPIQSVGSPCIETNNWSTPSCWYQHGVMVSCEE